MRGSRLGRAGQRLRTVFLDEILAECVGSVGGSVGGFFAVTSPIMVGWCLFMTFHVFTVGLGPPVEPWFDEARRWGSTGRARKRSASAGVPAGVEPM